MMRQLVSRLMGVCLLVACGCSGGTDEPSAPLPDDAPASTAVLDDTPSPTVERSEMVWSRAPNNEGVFFADDWYTEQFIWYTEQFMTSVTSGGPGLVAVGGEDTNMPVGEVGAYRPSSDAAVWTSADGVSWSRVHDWLGSLEKPGEQSVDGVTAGGPGLVAVGFVFAEPNHEGLFAAVWTSPDGLTWSRVPDDDAVFGGSGFEMPEAQIGSSIASVTVGGPGLVAVGGYRRPHPVLNKSESGAGVRIASQG